MRLSSWMSCWSRSSWLFHPKLDVRSAVLTAATSSIIRRANKHCSSSGITRTFTADISRSTRLPSSSEPRQNSRAQNSGVIDSVYNVPDGTQSNRHTLRFCLTSAMSVLNLYISPDPPKNSNPRSLEDNSNPRNLEDNSNPTSLEDRHPSDRQHHSTQCK